MPDMIKLKREKAEEVKKIVTLTEAVDKRSDHRMTADEKTEFDTIQKRIADIDEDIRRTELVDKIRSGEAVEKPVDNTPEKRTWENTGEWLLALRAAERTGRVDPRLVLGDENRTATGQSIGIPADGGFLVDTDTATSIFSKMHEASVVSSKCKHITIGPNSNGVKMPYIDESSRTDGCRWGNALGYWRSEATAITSSKIKFGRWQCDLETVGALMYSTEEMLQDSQQLGSIFTQCTSEELAFKVDDAIIRGDGIGKPLGILNSPALVTVAKESGQAADTIVGKNIVKMYSRLYGPSRSNAVWLVNQDVEPQLMQMAFGDSTSVVVPIYLPANGISGQPYSTLMGRPVIPCEHCSTLGDVGDILFVDLSQYCVIEKGGVQSAQSIHVKFVEMETAFRTTYRCNGQPLWNSALTPAHGSTTLSPFVALAAR